MIYISNNDARNHPILINSLGMYLPWTILCRFPSFQLCNIFYVFKIEKWTDLSSYQSSPELHFLTFTLCTTAYVHIFLRLATSHYRSMKYRKILLSIQSLFCEHWNFPHHLVTVFKKGIGEQLIYVYTQNMTLFVVHATVHHTIVLCVSLLYKQHIYKTELLSIMQITRWDARCHAC